jgi:hypothetical protein
MFMADPTAETMRKATPGEGRRLTLDQAVNEACPWSGKPVAADALTFYRGAVVGFCNPGCRDKFDSATRHFEAALAARQEG